MSLLLGGVLLDGFEVSGGVRFGGTQRLDVHELSGGGRVVDVLGRTDGPIEFSGFFTGADAQARARLLDALRASGAAVPLVWDAYFYTVVIRELTMRYAQPFWIGFTVTCTVVRDEAQAVADAVLGAAASFVAGALSALPSLAAPFAASADPAAAFGAASGSAKDFATTSPAGFS